MNGQPNDPRDEARRLADELIDYAIFAPLGAALAVAEELPELVRRGRERFGPRIALAQMFGQRRGRLGQATRRGVPASIDGTPADRTSPGRDRPGGRVGSNAAPRRSPVTRPSPPPRSCRGSRG